MKKINITSMIIIVLLSWSCFGLQCVGSESIPDQTADVPIWEKGTTWIYTVDDIDIELDTYYYPYYPEMSLHIQGGIDELPVIVEEVTNETYVLSFSSRIQGEVAFEGTLYGIPLKGTVKDGWLRKLDINGQISVNKQDLGIKQITVQCSGCFIARCVKPIYLPALRIPLDITLSTTMDNPLPLIDFPLSLEQNWGIPETMVSIDGTIESIWLQRANSLYTIGRLTNIIPIEFDEYYDLIKDFLPVIDISDILEAMEESNTVIIPETPGLFQCTSFEPIIVEAGSFVAYEIQFPMNTGHYHYSSEAENIVYIEGNISHFLPGINNIAMELQTIHH